MVSSEGGSSQYRTGAAHMPACGSSQHRQVLIICMTYMQAKAQEVLRRQMRHVLYTEPSAPQAGQEMTVYYNPSNTDLTGSPEVYITVRTSDSALLSEHPPTKA